MRRSHRRFGTASLALLVSWLPAVAAAQTATPAQKGSEAESVHRDPNGVRGLSPAWEAIGKGDALVVARDYDGAIAVYREAVKKTPDFALLHYRLAAAQTLKGDLQEAELSYQAAFRFAGSDAELKAKVAFCLADLSERQKAWDVAIERWTAAEAAAKSSEKGKVWAASAAERKKRVQDWQQNAADSAQTKARSDKRLQQADAAARKSAK